jgi:hypothetical protein
MSIFSTCRLLAAGVLGCAAVLAAGYTTASAAPARSVSVPETGARTFIATGQALAGPALHEPACRGYGCQLSGDSTAFLVDMKWSSWTAKHAVGSGTYNIDSCNPDCAGGKVYHVATVVTFSQPVKACFGKNVRWYWTRASFKYPHGLPKALQGQNAPLNPWNFSGLAAAARQSCR